MGSRQFSRLERNEPLFKFGPGGEFVNCLERNRLICKTSKLDPISKILAMLGDIIGTAIMPEFITNCGESESICKMIKTENPDKDISIETHEGKRTANHTPAIGDYETHGQLSVQPTLFSDDPGNSTANWHKPGNSIRTHRRSAKKRIAGKIDWQGSLFEINTRRAKSA